jgi:hypothetical protein
MDPANPKLSSRGRLYGAKLSALVRSHFGELRTEDNIPISAVGLGVGAALSQGSTAWVLVEDKPERGLGVALTWAIRHGASRLHVLVPQSGGLVARRAAEFTIDISVWSMISDLGTDRAGSLELQATSPEHLTDEASVDDRHLKFVDLIIESGADVVIEHGVVCGEVRGLEVCRVITDAVTGECRLEVGVGIHDREAFGLMHGDIPTLDSLRRITNVVAGHRRFGADPHPLNRLGAERALRSQLIAEPSLVGATALRGAAPATPRFNLKDPVPCVAVGTGNEGQPLIVVCSTGIDIDVVPFAADARLFHGTPETELVIAVPERDATSLTQQLAGTLRNPARVIGMPYA